MTTNPEPSSVPIKILLAEDDLGQANLTMKIFSEAKTPFEIVRVRDGEEAIRYLKKEGSFNTAKTPDMILLDVNMPRMNGFEVLENLKSDPLLSEIPVLMLTCSNSDADKALAYEKKANFYIVKPGELYQFYDVVKYVEEIWLSGLKQAKP